MGNKSSRSNSGGAPPSVESKDEGTELQLCLLPSAGGSGRSSPTTQEQNSLEKGTMEGKKTAEQPKEPKMSWSRFIAPVCASLAIFWHFLLGILPVKFTQAVAAVFAFVPALLHAVTAAVPALLQLTAVWKGFLTLDDNNFRLQKIEKSSEEMKQKIEKNNQMLEELLKRNGLTPPDDRAGKNDASVNVATPPEPKADDALAQDGTGGGGDGGDEDDPKDFGTAMGAPSSAPAAPDGGGGNENKQPPAAQPSSSKS